MRRVLLVIVGPNGVGKTTITGRVTAGRLGKIYGGLLERVSLVVDTRPEQAALEDLR